MTDRLSPIFPFPCDRCGRCTGCPCVVDPDELATVTAWVARRFRDAREAGVRSHLSRRRAA